MAEAPNSPQTGQDREKILIRLALRRQIVSREQVEYCLNIQKQLRARGQKASIPQILLRAGILSRRQVEALLKVTEKAIRRVSTKLSNSPQLPHELDPQPSRDRRDVMHSIRTQFTPEEVARTPKASSRSKPTSKALNLHIPKHRLDRMRIELSRDDFKQTLVDLLRDGALNGPPVDPNGETPVPFGPFKKLELLGQGGMAMVYKVYDDDTRQDVALKVMKPGIARNREYVLRFLREACNTALIRHPNTVNLFSLGAVDGRLYFTLELIEGKTLKERMQEGPITPAFGLEVLRQVMDGMIAAHEQGVTHRDLKPSNIMITTDEAQFGFGIKGDSNTVVKVMDFGLARQVDGEAVGKITQEGEFLGTAKYVAPELIRGEEPTLQSDIFALGIMAFQMFSGEPPFKVRSKVEYIEANLKWRTPLISDVTKDVSRGIVMLVDAMLDKDPVERPSADVLLRDIERLERLGPNQQVPTDIEDDDSIFHPKTLSRRSKRRKGQNKKQQFDWQVLLKDPKILAVTGGCVLFLVCLWILLKVMGGGNNQTIDDRPKPPKNPKVVKKTPTVIDRTISKLEGFQTLELPHDSNFNYSNEKKLKFTELCKTGDSAWRDKKWDVAQSNWSEALKMVKLPALEQRLNAIQLKEIDRDIDQARRRNEWQKVADLCEKALEKSPGNSQFEKALRNAQQKVALQTQAQSLRDKFKAAILEKHAGEAQSLISELKGLMQTHGRGLIDPDAVYTKLEFQMNELVRSMQKQQKADEYFEQCLQSVENQNYRLAQTSLDSAKNQVGEDNKKFRKFQRYVTALKNVPKGYIYLPPTTIDTFGRKREIEGMYVSKKPITNKDYLIFLGNAGKGLRRPSSWPAGVFPEDKPTETVTLVRQEEAEKYAKSLSGRLPTGVEIQRFHTHVDEPKATINKTDRRGRFEFGFFVVIPVS